MTTSIPDNRPPTPNLPLVDLAAGGLGTGNALLARDFWDQCLAVGEVAPEFILPNGAGERISLEQLLDAGPVVVVFEHGQSCAAWAEERRILEESAAALHATGASLVVISADCSVAASAQNGAGHGWHEILWDCDGSVAHLFGLLCRVSGRCVEALRNAGIDVPVGNGHPEAVLNARAHYILDGGATVRHAAIDLAHDRPLDIAAIVGVLDRLINPQTASD